LGCSSVYIQVMNIPAPGSVWPFANESWIGIMAGFGSNRPPDKDPISNSPSPSESAAGAGRPLILVVEDNKGDVFLIREAIRAAELDAELYIVQDGERALRFIEQVDANESLACPRLVIMDINLPKKQGGEVLEQMRKSRRCADAVTIVVTSSDSDKDREAMAKLGAREYFRKPSQYDDFMKLGDVIKRLLSEVPEKGQSSSV
jgi:two-component system, chemotaxis family, response regulator Rcp1